MKTRLVFDDGSSHKFWHIEINGAAFTVTYGRVGSTGQSSTKSFADAAACSAAAGKLVREKRAKGYADDATEKPSDATQSAATQADVGAPPPVTTAWDALTGAALQRALVDHFRYLADTPGYAAAIDAVFAAAFAARMEGTTLVVDFPGGEQLKASAPAKKVAARLPASFKALLTRHARIELTEARLLLGDHGCFEPEWLEEAESSLLELVKPSQIVSPLWDYSDCWLYHPEEKNPTGEPVIYYLSHEGGDVDDAQSINAGALFLTRMARSLNVQLDVSAAAAGGGGDGTAWWDGLNDAWRKVLAEHKITRAEDASKAARLKSLFIPESSAIASLEPLRACTALTQLDCDAAAVSDLTPLSGLVKLSSLRIASPPVTDASPLAQLTALSTLSLADTHITDLAPLAGLKKLTTLDVAGTPVTDLRPLKGLVKLERIDVSQTGVTDLAPLAGLARLRDLDVSGTRVNDISPVAALPRLFTLKLRNTAVTSLAPLFGNAAVGILAASNTAIPFRDVLRFEGGAVSLYTAFSDDAPFVEALEALANDKDVVLAEVAPALVRAVSQRLLSVLRRADSKPEVAALAPRLLAALLRLPVSFEDGRDREELASNAVVCVMKVGVDPALHAALFDRLIPHAVNNPLLAFNLACFAARSGDRARLLHYTRLAVQKGQDPSRFLTDADFGGVRDDPAFLSAAQTPPYPDPEEDPLGWWGAVPEDFRQHFMGLGDAASGAEIRSALHDPNRDLYLDNLRSLEPLRGLVGLKRLSLRECRATGLDVLSTLRGLESLTVENSGYQDSATRFNDIAALRPLVQLVHLDLKGHNIEDIGAVAGMTRLEKLHVFGSKLRSVDALRTLTALTDVSIATAAALDTQLLAHLTGLQMLSLGGSVVSLEGLRSLTKLRMLWLNNIATADARPLDVAPLAACTALEYLCLAGVQFSGASALFGLRTLKTIVVTEKLVAPNLKKEMKEKMPWCELQL